MHRKQSEETFRRMMSDAYNCHIQKWRDVMRCNKCGNLIYKMDKALDYTVFFEGGHFAIFECKQATDRFEFGDLREGQREIANGWIEMGTQVYIFLLLQVKGKARPLKYLIPYQDLLELERISDRKSATPEMLERYLIRDVDDIRKEIENETRFIRSRMETASKMENGY